MTGGSLEFTDLPLIEVALKRVPKSHLPISLPFIFELRKLLPKRFDRILDLEMVEQPPGPAQPALYDVHSTCGCRLIDSEMGIVVTLQPDMLVARWMLAEGKGYPRFAALREAADQVVSAVDRVGLVPFEAALVNMAYANRVDATVEGENLQPSPWPLADRWTPVAITENWKAFETQSVVGGPDGIDRRVVVQFRRETDDAQPWYLLLTIAGKVMTAGESLADGEDAVHNALIEWFPQLLSQKAKQAYGFKE